MSLLHLPLCVLGKHERSRGQAHEVDGHTESVCRHCGVRMRKKGLRWQVVR